MIKLPKSEILASFGENLKSIVEKPVGREDVLLEKLKGAGYWNIRNEDGSVNEDEKKKWRGIVNHILLEYNFSLYIAKKLKEVGEQQDIQELKDLKLSDVADASFIIDIAKRRSEEARASGKAPEDKDIHTELGYQMAKQIGLPEHVCRVARSHDFPLSEDELPTWLERIVFIADVHTSQSYITVDQRMNDVRIRWITQRQEKGLNPLLNPQLFKKYEAVAHSVNKQIMDLLGISDERTFLANIPHLREERYLRALFERNMEDRGMTFAKRLEGLGNK